MKLFRNWVLFFLLTIGGFTLVNNNDLHRSVQSIGFLLWAVSFNLKLYPDGEVK
ncbi:hypothetical protein [Bacillus mycoides]|uniref:hypothetical protein n=1 Tax=Bacillus mycoides TaxID=1405 RepID=UPI00027C177C|nr:hypothetical protein [Bacillus mycoides]EJV59309.1 hypothetical protein IEU_05574 [Bacillus mycoides]